MSVFIMIGIFFHHHLFSVALSLLSRVTDNYFSTMFHTNYCCSYQRIPLPLPFSLFTTYDIAFVMFLFNINRDTENNN